MSLCSLSSHYSSGCLSSQSLCHHQTFHSLNVNLLFWSFLKDSPADNFNCFCSHCILTWHSHWCNFLCPNPSWSFSLKMRIHPSFLRLYLLKFSHKSCPEMMEKKCSIIQVYIHIWKKHTRLYQSLFNLMSIFSLSSLNFQSGCNGNLSVDFPMYLHFLFRFISLYLSLGKYVPVWCIFCLQKIIENLWLVYSSPSRTDSLVCLLKGNFLPNKYT